jgi:hypothetical protein
MLLPGFFAIAVTRQSAPRAKGKPRKACGVFRRWDIGNLSGRRKALLTQPPYLFVHANGPPVHQSFNRS